MKKLRFMLLLVFVSNNIFAQPLLPDKFDAQLYGKELEADKLFLVAERNIAELNETVNVYVRITTITSRTAAGFRLPFTFNYDFKDPFDAPWKISDFRIVSGGGSVLLQEGYLAQLKMPATMPAEKSVTVQATLKPIDKKAGEVQLFTTIYLADNKNVFYFDCPAFGVFHEKYIVNPDAGIFTKMDSLVKKGAAKTDNAKAKTKSKEYYMKEAAAEITAADRGYNLATLTSNAKAFYSKEDNSTAIILMGDKVAMVRGKAANTKRSYTINISIPGQEAGSFKIKTKKQIGVAITLPTTNQGCGCHDDPDDAAIREAAGEAGPTCFGGTVFITRYDKKNKIIEGHFHANVEGMLNLGLSAVIIYGTLDGKFSVPLAN